jgi:hypothetical protein
MAILRILLLAFNVAVLTFLIYRLLQVYQSPGDVQRKRIIVVVGLLLVIVPVLMIVRIVPASPLYLFLYPVALSLFIYLIRHQGRYS